MMTERPRVFCFVEITSFCRKKKNEKKTNKNREKKDKHLIFFIPDTDVCDGKKL